MDGKIKDDDLLFLLTMDVIFRTNSVIFLYKIERKFQKAARDL